MAGLEPLVVVWKGSGVRMVVLLSFAVQVILLALADVRRYFNLRVLKAIIWSAYMLADTAAVYALGHMSLVSKSPEHHLMALWAPLLLVHLGGQDNITAYAIEDNQLWLRHLQNFGVQVIAAAYVLHVSTVLGSQTWLRSASIVIFVVGVLKYGERVVALLCACSYASSSLSATSYKDFLSRHKRPDVNSATSPAHERVDVLDAPPRHRVELQLIAYTLLDVPKKMFEGPTRYVEIYGAQRLRGEDMFRVVVIQLSMMYDLLYTKAAVVHGWYGDKDGGYSYNRADVVATYVLLGGALVVETTSVGSNEELFIWSVELDLDESILVWHIATHLCLTWLQLRDGRSRRRRVDLSKVTDLDVVTALSNYMFFLLATRPYMLPYPVSRQRYVQLCHDVITPSEDQLGSIEGQVRAWNGTPPLALGVSDMNKTLEKGCELARQLLTMRTPDTTTLHMIRDVWVEMLCYAAYRCNENFHAKHLNDGGMTLPFISLTVTLPEQLVFVLSLNSVGAAGKCLVKSRGIGMHSSFGARITLEK
ncbi:hypothetical protein CFC21_074270 [Triticum aestivum]|uniref:DUF4220 domain-containing protein n=2 Tax=Triticum aestivum TaxID=4565 RepID=A0A3B6LVT8_WHEAT|nr:hypothetical protein CFC21_074270 [Triticum aestivum]